jgi:predicted nucleic acid-binding protein
MTYLLDANVLIAIGYTQHQFHPRVGAWVTSGRPGNELAFATCAITELAFVRVGAQAGYSVDVATARRALSQLKKNKVISFRFIPDDLGIESLPKWVKTPRQTTDGYLVALAARHGTKLATLDKGIPGTFQIPG